MTQTENRIATGLRQQRRTLPKIVSGVGLPEETVKTKILGMQAEGRVRHEADFSFLTERAVSKPEHEEATAKLSTKNAKEKPSRMAYDSKRWQSSPHKGAMQYPPPCAFVFAEMKS